MLWILLVIAVAAAIAMFEFWPNKPGRAHNGIETAPRFKGVTRVNRLDRVR